MTLKNLYGAGKSALNYLVRDRSKNKERTDLKKYLGEFGFKEYGEQEKNLLNKINGLESWMNHSGPLKEEYYIAKEGINDLEDERNHNSLHIIEKVKSNIQSVKDNVLKE